MRKSKEEIINELKESFDLLAEAGKLVPEELFNVSKEGKWTTAENIRHLATSAKMTTLAFTLPKITHLLLYGKPKRTSHGYSKLVENYEKKLEGGAHATGVYVPRKTDYRKTELITNLNENARKLVRAIAEKWTDQQLDEYQVAHPILGVITVRELAYFTIYHNHHHLQTIRKYYLGLPQR
jgi:hypothetical protein